MNQEPHIHPIGHQHSPTYHGFWPMFLIGLSLLLIFAWEIWVGVDTRRAAQQLQEKQVRMVDQAKQAQASLEKLVRGLVDLSKTDDAAKKVITKFGIKVNNPSVPAAIPIPRETIPRRSCRAPAAGCRFRGVWRRRRNRKRPARACPILARGLARAPGSHSGRSRRANETRL